MSPAVLRATDFHSVYTTPTGSLSAPDLILFFPLYHRPHCSDQVCENSNLVHFKALVRPTLTYDCPIGLQVVLSYYQKPQTAPSAAPWNTKNWQMLHITMEKQHYVPHKKFQEQTCWGPFTQPLTTRFLLIEYVNKYTSLAYSVRLPISWSAYSSILKKKRCH
jgi:hypothetical protein